MKEPREVFTPRGEIVNPRMYVHRGTLEIELLEAVRGSLHIVIHGESGCGKTWLYKGTLAQHNIFYLPVNLANARRLGSIAATIRMALATDGDKTLSEIEETKTAGMDAVFASGQLETARTYTVDAAEQYLAALKEIRKRAGKKKAFIVLDNLERIFKYTELMEELADLLLLLDDEIYGAFHVRMIIVGTPGELREYYGAQDHLLPVVNRLCEVSEVSRLLIGQAQQIIVNGFERELGWKIEQDDRNYILSYICSVTDRIPQFLHEYCLQLAFAAEATHRLNRAILSTADKRWLKSGISSSYNKIEGLMNEGDAGIGRRNQVLFTLGQMRTDEFTATEVEKQLRQSFPQTTGRKALNVPFVLHQLDGDHGILRRASHNDRYLFKHPRYKMTLQLMLSKDERERISKVEWEHMKE